jgi:hypothetical protein
MRPTTRKSIISFIRMDTQPAQKHPMSCDHKKAEKSELEDPTPQQPQFSRPASKQRSRLAKRWRRAQTAASTCCFLLFIVSVRAFWKTRHDYSNRVHESPYAQSYRAGLWSGMICAVAQVTSCSTRSASQVLSANEVSLTMEARRRRVVRMPMIVRAAAFVHVVAAAMNTLAAYRMLCGPLGSGIVAVMAIVAA